MFVDDLKRLEKAMSTPEMLDQSVDYLAENMRKFLNPGEKIIICFSDRESGNIGDLLARAANRIGVPRGSEMEDIAEAGVSVPCCCHFRPALRGAWIDEAVPLHENAVVLP